MARERLVSPDLISKEEEFNRSLRPPTLVEYVGQKKVVEKLSIALQAARGRGEPLEHALFYGPPGLVRQRWLTSLPRPWGRRSLPPQALHSSARAT